MIKQRKLSVGERIMYVAETEAINCIFPIRINGSFNPNQVQSALHKLQEKHPLLRSVIKPVNGQPSFIVQDIISDIPILIHDRLDNDHWKEFAEKSWKDYIDVSKGPLAKLLWIRGEPLSEFILICPHCIADGVSFTAVLRDFLHLLDDIDTAIGTPQPLIVDDTGAHTISVFKRAQINVKASVGKAVAHLFLPKQLNYSKTISLDGTYMVRHRIEAEEMQRLLSCCKRQQVSLYALMAAVFFEVGERVLPKSKGKLICPVDIRKYLKNLKEDQLFAFAPIIDLKASKKNATWELAKDIKQQLQNGLSKIDIHEITYINEHFQSLVPKLLNHLRTAEGSHDFTFSNMGNLALPQQFRNFKLEEVYSPTVAFPWKNPNTMVMSTYKGILDITFTSNEAILPKAKANQFLAQAVERLVKLTTETITSIP